MMYRLIVAACLSFLVLAHVASSYPAQLDQLNEDSNPVAKRFGSSDDVLYRVQRSKVSCSNNCLDCGNTWSTKFATDLCMEYCRNLKSSHYKRITDCRAFYLF